jgi:hypothetical protein
MKKLLLASAFALLSASALAQPWGQSAGDSFLAISANGYSQVKAAAGVLDAITVNTAGLTSAVAFYDGISSTVTMTQASPAVITWTAHGMAAGTPVVFSTTGTLYTGLTAGTVYYVSTTGLAANAFEVSDTLAHALAGTNMVNTSSTQSGVQACWNLGLPIGAMSTLAIGNETFSPLGVKFVNGLIASATGGTPANLTVMFH